MDELLGTTDGVPERDFWRASQKHTGTLDEGLYVRLLHVRPQEVLFARPTLDEHEARFAHRTLRVSHLSCLTPAFTGGSRDAGPPSEW
ncbi:MAG TPA: hypothetical protein VFG21_04320, partial [Xanthomonadaceae bacterium]|nr:hypothetical protein [Xanthomonadaceae bacterium]